MLQKYVVPGFRAPGEYDAAVCPLATCDGGFVVPNRTYPPREDALADAAVVLDDLDQLTVGVVDELMSGPPRA